MKYCVGIAEGGPFSASHEGQHPPLMAALEGGTGVGDGGIGYGIVGGDGGG